MQDNQRVKELEQFQKQSQGLCIDFDHDDDFKKFPNYLISIGDVTRDNQAIEFQITNTVEKYTFFENNQISTIQETYRVQ